MADMQFAMNKIDVAGFAEFNVSDIKRLWFNGVCRADADTAAARVTKLLKGQYIFFDADNSAVLANFAAFTAGGAFFQIDLRYIYINLLAAGYFGL